MSSPSQNGIFTRPHVIDGEGVDPTDFENLSGGARATLNDLIVGAWMRSQLYAQAPSSVVVNPTDDSLISTPQIFAMSAQAGAPVNDPAVVRGISCTAGTIFYVNGQLTPDGVAPKAIPYYVQAGEITGVLGVGDATHPRFDAVYVRITDVDGPTATRDFKDALGAITSQPLVTTKQSKLEWIGVAGTPSATPTIPAAPDSTWAPWGVWYVPKNWNTYLSGVASAFGSGVLDYRVPLGMRRYIQTVDNGGLWLSGGGAVPGNGYITTTGTGFSGSVGATCPVRSGRVLGVSWTLALKHASGFQRYITKSLFASSVVAEPPGWATIYSGIHSGDPTIAATDLDNYVLVGGKWLNPSGVLTTTNASGLAVLPIWANGLTSETADSGVADFGGTANGSGTDWSWFASYWCPGASGDVVMACVFDVAGF